jgi:hypothetical protein
LIFFPIGWTIGGDIVPSSGPNPVFAKGSAAGTTIETALIGNSNLGNDKVTGTRDRANGQAQGALRTNSSFIMGAGHDEFSGTGDVGENGKSGYDGDPGAVGVNAGSNGADGLDGANGRLSFDLRKRNGQRGGNGGDAGSVGEDGKAGAAGLTAATGIELNASTLNMATNLTDSGSGNDVIKGVGGDGAAGGNGGAGGDGGNAAYLAFDGGIGIYISVGSLINTSDGADSITGEGGDGGLGGNGGTGDAGKGGLAGIGGFNRDALNCIRGKANGGITGLDGTDGGHGLPGVDGGDGDAGKMGLAIKNDGTVNMGAGADTVDGLKGGFDGTGTHNMGSGNDSVYGFGNAKFNGGADFDTLFLPGTLPEYTITFDLANVNNFTVAKGGMTLTATSFESIQFV